MDDQENRECKLNTLRKSIENVFCVWLYCHGKNEGEKKSYFK